MRQWFSRSFAALSVFALSSIVVAHYALPRIAVENPVPVVGDLVVEPVSTQTQWFCVRADGVVDDGPFAAVDAADQSCGTLVAGDGVTRFLEERVTERSATTQTTSTQQFEIRGGTGIRVSQADAQFLVGPGVSSGGGASSGSGGGDFAFTPTHFVAPWASVSGATSNTDTTNGPSINECTTAGNPCTAEEVFTTCSGDEIVQFAVGVYDRNAQASTGSDWEPVWHPNSTCDGTSSSSRTIFYCEVFAASYRVTNGSVGFTGSDVCELRNANQAGGVAVIGTGSTIGCSDHTAFVGFAAQEAYAPNFSGHGIFGMIQTCTDIWFVQNYYQYDGPHSDPNDNYDGIGCYTCTNSGYVDNFLEGNFGTGNHNNAAMKTYSGINHTVKNNTCVNINSCFYAKGDFADNGLQNYGEISFNQVDGNSTFAFTTQTTEDAQNLNFHNNLVTDGPCFEFDNSDSGADAIYTFHHNTCVGNSSGAGVDYAIRIDYPDDENGDKSIVNNIFYDDGTDDGFSHFMISDEGDGSNITVAIALADFVQIDYNGYDDTDGAASWEDFDGSYTFTTWKAALASAGLPANAREANSFEGTITFVGGGIYCLSDNMQTALTASSTGEEIGAFSVECTEDMGVRTNPDYSSGF